MYTILPGQIQGIGKLMGSTLHLTSDGSTLHLTSDRGTLHLTSDRGTLHLTSDRGTLHLTSDGELTWPLQKLD